MLHALEAIRAIGLFLRLAAYAVHERIASAPVRIAAVGILTLAAVQVTTGQALIGESSQRAAENVCELLLLIGLGNAIHDDVERLPHEGER